MYEGVVFPRHTAHESWFVRGSSYKNHLVSYIDLESQLNPFFSALKKLFLLIQLTDSLLV